jgi:hypothetical protein
VTTLAQEVVGMHYRGEEPAAIAAHVRAAIEADGALLLELDKSHGTVLAVVLGMLRGSQRLPAVEIALALELLQHGAGVHRCRRVGRRWESAYDVLTGHLSEFMARLQDPAWLELCVLVIKDVDPQYGSEDRSLLASATLAGNAALVTRLLAAGAILPRTDHADVVSRYRRAHRAAYEALHAADQLRDARDDHGETLLMAVVRDDDPAFAAVLLRGCDVNAVIDRKHARRRTALGLARSEAMVRTLLDGGANPDTWCEDGRTALQAALERHDRVPSDLSHDLLLAAGADIARRSRGPSPFDRAVADALAHDPRLARDLITHVPAQVVECAGEALAEADLDERSRLLERLRDLATRMLAGDPAPLATWVDEENARR